MLASQIFNSGLVRKIGPGLILVLTVTNAQVMAEMVELRRVNPCGKRSTYLSQSDENYADPLSLVLELGASTSLPTLLSSTFDPPPESILTTDYPDNKLIQ